MEENPHDLQQVAAFLNTIVFGNYLGGTGPVYSSNNNCIRKLIIDPHSFGIN